MQPRFIFGGEGPLLHIAVANGFPPQTYRPLAATLTPHFHVLNLPPRALWPGERPPQERRTWKQMLARDLMDSITAFDLHDIVAVGHSFGGVASLLAAIGMPSRFRALILLDPTILPQPAMWWMRLSQLLGRDLGNPLAKGADRRRDRFESREYAAERLRRKTLFADWHADAFQGYIDALLPDNAQDAPPGGVQLAWPKAWEAYYFRTLYTGTWGDLPRLRRDLPVMVLRGANSDTFLSSAADRFKRLVPQATMGVIDGHGHLFPQSAPQETGERILAWLREHDLITS